MPSADTAHNNVDAEPTETTALLHRSIVNSEPQPRLPFVEPVVSRIRSSIPAELVTAGIGVDANLDPIQGTSFTLIVLLSLRSLLTEAHNSPDIIHRWTLEQGRSRDADELERRIFQTFTEMLDSQYNDKEMQSILWLGFPYSRSNTRVVRVIDLLSYGSETIPSRLLSHRVIALSLLKVWNNGLPLIASSHKLGEGLFYRFSNICPPRFIHLLDLIFELAYLVVLSNFLLVPPSRPVIIYGPSPLGIRSIFLMLYSASSLLRTWSLSILPAAIVLLSFMTCLPAVPYPGDTAFDALLLAMSLQILGLHLPQAPSPALLFNVERSLPLSTLFLHVVQRVLYPALLFFLPTLLITSYLLSTSLSDTFLQMQALLGLVSPMETRATFMVLGVVVLLLFISFVVLLTLLFPSLLSLPNSPWDRYTEPVGLESRRLFARSVVIYSTPYFFPPLLNLVPFVLIRVPKMFLYVVGRRNVLVLDHVEAVLWWLLVTPLGFLIASIRLWGILH